MTAASLGSTETPDFVMAGFIPAIHVFDPEQRKTWITGT